MAYYILKSYKLKISPFEVFKSLENEKNCFFLDSSLNSHRSLGRYSFLGIDPFYVLETKNQEPFKKLRRLLAEYKISLPGSPLPFLGGAVGYLAYDLGFLLEKKLKKRTVDDLGIPDCVFGFYNTVVATDNIKKLLYIFTIGFPEKGYRLSKALCEHNFKKIYSLLSKAAGRKIDKQDKLKTSPLRLKSNFSKEDYLLAINKAKRYIRAGDIYLVNLSQRFQAQTSFSASRIYQRLRQISPAYFSAYLALDDFQILSSSPERFLSLGGNRIVTTRPMKGTRGRSQDRLKDKGLKRELLKSAKDQAELLMIVDLQRNDLGKVCSYDSIRVNKLRQLEEYSTVFQTTATVSGCLHKDKDRVDLLRASFPGGSITGCPKIRAMEIIEELEPNRRSIYTGSLGYLSFSGNIDFNILIRTILKKKDKLYFGVGGGIVADSKPEEEYEETLVKARGMLSAINAI
ncbi:MAG: aminodeoxychorismate synthase component I [Candidatus Omnitrophica bacterium]|nr:aminodeoxychorismate synthase component I [Candidatus Omnitrophota bacterium]